MTVERKPLGCEEVAIGKAVNLAEKIGKGLFELAEKLIDGARQGIESSELIPPCAFIGDELTHNGVCVGLDFSDENAKDMSMQAVRKIAKSKKADFVIVLSESFVLANEAAADYTANRDKYPSMSDHPGAQDCLMVSIDTHAGIFVGRGPIVGKAGGKRTLRPVEFLESKNAEGRMTGLLPDRAGETIH